MSSHTDILYEKSKMFFSHVYTFYFIYFCSSFIYSLICVYHTHYLIISRSFLRLMAMNVAVKSLLVTVCFTFPPVSNRNI